MMPGELNDLVKVSPRACQSIENVMGVDKMANSMKEETASLH